jgi:nucleotide-binding universal stress UspA family protein
VVGVSGLGQNDPVEWAAAEAASRHGSLRIVHAYFWSSAAASINAGPVYMARAAAQEAAERVVEEATCRARSVAPELDITSEIVVGATAPVLLRHAKRADLVVLGGRSARRAGLGNSVVIPVTARSAAPVAVVGGLHRTAPGPSAARVVVGVDGCDSSSSAIAYAFRAAAQRGLGLTALHACGPPGSSDGPPLLVDPGRLQGPARTLYRAMAPWLAAFPGVDVLQKLALVAPASALVAESAGAALVVVGCRGRSRLKGRLLGSVSQTVLRTADSPTAVVRRDCRVALESPN